MGQDGRTLLESPARRLVNFAAIYFAQGLPMGFAVFAVPAWLAEARVSTTDIGMLAATTMLPWAFKVLWAPLVDRFKYRVMGRFRAWILGAQLGLMVSTAALLVLPDPLTRVHALATTLFAQALFASMSDVAGDGLAIEVLPSGERGLTNAVMSGAQAAGNVIGGAGLSAVLAAAGFRAATALSLLLLGIACTPTVLLRERPGERLLPWTPGAATHVHADGVRLAIAGSGRLLARSVLAAPSARALVTWMTAYFVSGSLNILMTATAVRGHGFRPAEYASVSALALAANLIGAFTAGRLADRKGRQPVVAGALALAAVTWAAFALVSPLWSIKGVWIVQALLTGAASGAFLTVLTALFMDLADPRIAATQFAIYMALGNLGSVLGRASAGMLEARFPLSAVTLGAGVLLAALAFWTVRSPAIPPIAGNV